MGILGKIIATAATKSVIKTVGRTAVMTTGGIVNAVDRRHASVDKRNTDKMDVLNAPDPEEYIGEHYLKARAAFVNAGFQDISFVELPDLRKGWFKKDGEVEEISIGGKTEVKRKEKFSPQTPIVIVYHTFANRKDSGVKNDKLQGEKGNSETLVHNTRGREEENRHHTNVILENEYVDRGRESAQQEKRVYCTKCGLQQSSNNSFCPACGQRLEN